MGEILSIKEEGEKKIVKIKTNLEELCQLRNHFKKIHVFSNECFCGRTKIMRRGNNGGTKYFGIPLILKSRRKRKFKKISYQKISIKNKTYYVFIGYPIEHTYSKKVAPILTQNSS